MIIIGDALECNPFKNLMYIVDGLETCPIVYINDQNKPSHWDLDFESSDFPHRLFIQGSSSEVLQKLARECGWENEFRMRCEDCDKRPPEEDIEEN